MTYLANKLNEYDTYTYNIKLYMVNPNILGKLDGAITSGEASLIADNASIAQYNINDIEQIFTVGHSKVREAMGNRFTLTIQEPNGVTLLSTLKLRSLELGIDSHIHAGYILSIEFNGRKADGRPHKCPQTFYYPLTITALDFKVTDGGTSYNVSMVENSTNGYGYLNNVIKEQITIVARTVGEFVTEFASAINISAGRIWELDTGSLYQDRYEFQFDESTESWKDWRFQVLDTAFESGGNEFVTHAESGDPALQVVINNGSNISAIFGQVLQLTAEYKRILVKQDGFGEKFLKSEVEGEVDINGAFEYFPLFFKAITNVDYGQYDYLKGAYEKIITYKLKAYAVTDEIISPSSYVNGITNTSVQRNRIANLISHNFLRKKYEYYYTGNNTEVLEFDMQFDYAYYSVTAIGGGALGDEAVQTPQHGGDVHDVIARLSERKRKLAKISGDLNSASAAGAGTGITELLRKKLKIEQTAFSAGIIADLTLLRELSELSESEINHTLRFAADAIPDGDMAGSDNDRKGGTLQFGAVKVNLENSADLISIELGIRGDPYWMGRPNSLLNQQRNDEDVADFEAGAPSFFLHVNLPTSSEDINGRRKPRPDYQISGVYTVRDVINRFQNGMFTQHLNAVRDLATNTSTAWSSLMNTQEAITGLNQAREAERLSRIAQDQEDAHLNIGPQ